MPADVSTRPPAKWVERHVEEDDARRQGRAAHRVVLPLDLPEQRQRRASRRCARSREATARRRHSRVRRRRAGARRAAQPHLRHRDPRAAARGRLAAEPAADRCRRCRCSTPADFEAGVGFRISGATAFPRADGRSAPPATSSWRSRPAGSPASSRARIGVHVNFAPVADVNNNPRNPVINTRSFGETPGVVGALASALRRAACARRRHDRDAEAFSRPRRHRRRLAPRPADHQASARAARAGRAARRSAAASAPAPTP